jgi:hypothetical protein
MQRWLRVLNHTLLFSFIGFSLAAACLAHELRGSITGKVTDPQKLRSSTSTASGVPVAAGRIIGVMTLRPGLSPALGATRRAPGSMPQAVPLRRKA